jgi:hypothetical protein
MLGESRITFFLFYFMFSYLNFIIYDFFQIQLATLIRV